jgi:glycosyltransferase involved in cell wall biosynthesis
MKFCAVIPCFDHAATIAAVAQSAKFFCPVIVVDDGSTQPLPDLPGCTVIGLGGNFGKGAALRAGFQRAVELGFTHAITMDADGQHFAEDLPKFLAAASAQPEALIVGVRDLAAAGCPKHRQRSNAVSTFWFRVETGVRLPDTQCGFRCYPLALAQKLKINSGRYAFELEFMVRAAWTGALIFPVPVKCTYEGGIRNSHFRPVRDLAHITFMNIGLVLQSWFVPRELRAAWSRGEKKGFCEAAKEIFSDDAHEPFRLALAVGIGLFCGLAPIWGFQMISTLALAHWLRLNKMIGLLASNISIPPVIPFILYGELVLGHRLCTGGAFVFSRHQLSHALVLQYFGQWCVGSLVLAVVLAVVGFVTTYGIARAVRKK